MKIFKWILGLLAGLASVVALFAGSKSKQKIKEIKKEISVAEQTQKNYEKTIKEMVEKKQLYNAPDVSGDEADKFIKDFLKKRKKKNG